jgi:hypothetical protein
VLLFALKTPARIFSSLIVFSSRNHPANANGVGVKVAEGVLCAVGARERRDGCHWYDSSRVSRIAILPAMEDDLLIEF